ncbi:MAG: protein-glutamate O-methyltransferase CheR [Clostridiaceae bacterium]
MDYEGFKAEIYKMSGINLSFYKEKQMKRRIESLVRKNGYELYEEYVQVLKGNQRLYNEFINYLTINVSEFCRNPAQWEVLKSDIIPFLLKKSGTPKIWSAACSTGDEPYTLVMVLNEYIPLRDIRIIATDIDREALRKAKTGVYTEKSLEKLPDTYLDKYFNKEGSIYTIKDEVKNQVVFSQHDLLKDEYPSECDMIVCRNVLIYFTEEAKIKIYTQFNKALKKEGILFVGSTEQIILANRYKLSPMKTFFYLKEGDLA